VQPVAVCNTWEGSAMEGADETIRIESICVFFGDGAREDADA
jgi:hypothetical protein